MHFSYKAFVEIFIVTINIDIIFNHRISRDGNRFGMVQSENNPYEEITDHYTFVALIDVVFTDGSKRTCTGTIIHDNAVITVAHCFKVKGDEALVAELTTSFVVIGTKKMFDTGYEQYLPIERVLFHPKYSGWSANIALVYTFSGMMSDKPGQIVPLAREKDSKSSDYNITVFSWGHFKDDNVYNNRHKKQTMSLIVDAGIDIKFELQNEKKTLPKKIRKRRRKKMNVPYTKSLWRLKKRVRSLEEDTKTHPTITKEDYQYFDNPENRDLKYSHNMSDFDSKEDEYTWNKYLRYLNNISKTSRNTESRSRKLSPKYSYGNISYYRNNWRRKMGTKENKKTLVLNPYFSSHNGSDTFELIDMTSVWKSGRMENKLTVEEFTFLYSHACKKILHKGFQREGNDENQDKIEEFVCYSSEDHFITDEDSGAPAMRHGQLIAITVGGIEYKGNHVAIGIKVSCYCSWISENLPNTPVHFKCCHNCCGRSSRDDNYSPGYKSAFMKVTSLDREI